MNRKELMAYFSRLYDLYEELFAAETTEEQVDLQNQILEVLEELSEFSNEE